MKTEGQRHFTEQAIAELNRIKRYCDKLIGFLEKGWDTLDHDEKDSIRYILWGASQLNDLSISLDKSFGIDSSRLFSLDQKPDEELKK